MHTRSLYSALYVAGTAAVALGIAVGFYHSLTADHRLPQVSLNDVVGPYLDDIDTLIQQGRHDRAMAELQLVLKMLPRERDLTHEMLGRALMAQQKFDEAAQQFGEAIAIDPDFAEAHHSLGIAYARQGRMDQAVAEVREALRLRPDYPAAQENLGRMEARLDRAAPTAGADDDPWLVRGRRVVQRFYRGELEGLHAELSTGFAAKLSLEQLTEMQGQVRRQLGPEQELLEERVVPLGESALYARRARFERHDGEVEVLIKLDGEAIDGLMFRPVDPGPGGAEP